MTSISVDKTRKNGWLSRCTMSKLIDEALDVAESRERGAN